MIFAIARFIKTLTRFIRAAQQSFCYTGILQVFWSDEGPQFTSKVFHQFQYNGSSGMSPHPDILRATARQSTVKAITNLIQSAWTGQRLHEDKLCHALLYDKNNLHGVGSGKPRGRCEISHLSFNHYPGVYRIHSIMC